MATETVTEHKYAMPSDSANRLQAVAAKLAAMLNHTFGNSGEAFRSLSDDLQDNYLWACAEMMEEIHEIVTELAPVKVE